MLRPLSRPRASPRRCVPCAGAPGLFYSAPVPKNPTPRASGLPKFGFVLLAGLSLVWGVTWPINKIALAEIDPFVHRAYMCLVGGAGLFLLTRLNRYPWRVPRGDWRMLVLTAFLNVTMWHIPLAFGLLMMKAGQAAVLSFTMPLWTVILSIFFLKERLSPRRTVALALGTIGLGFMIAQSMTSEDIHPWGVGLILLAAACWAVGTVLIKGYHWSVPSLSLATWQLILGGIPSVLIGAVLGDLDISGVSAQALYALSFTIVLPVMFGYYAWFKVIEIFPASVASIGTLLIPVLGMVSGWMILGEPISLADGAALAAITLAVALVMYDPGGR